MFKTNPGDEVIVTANGETLTCKVLRVVGQGTHGTFSASIVEPTAHCCDQFRNMVTKGVFGGNEIVRDGSWWVLATHLKSRMTCCPFCGTKL